MALHGGPSHRNSPVGPWTALGGAGLTIVASLVAGRYGGQVSLGAVAGVGALIGLVLLFLRAPHVAVALTIPLFAAIPLLKVFVNPLAGSLKELVILSAAIAALISWILERRHVDALLAGSAALLFALYFVNVGSGEHDTAWLQGVRLVGEPIVLLLIGLSFPDPQRVLRWGSRALVLTCTAAAGYGILQHLVGQDTLLGWGYEYGKQVRNFNGHLRSFGTSDDPFTYAALLYLGLVAIALERRRPAWTTVAAAVILGGLLFSYVRTAVIVVVVIGGLYLVRKGLSRQGGMLMVAAGIAGVLVLVSTSGTATSSYSIQASQQTGGRLNVILNGRVSAWTAAVGDKASGWVIGRGVGKVGTAAARAGYTLTAEDASDPNRKTTAVDSGYLATVADVGLLGLAVFLTLLGRIGVLAAAGAREGREASWLAVGLLAVLLVDALTRASFTGFPAAFLGLLLIGVSLAAAREQPASTPSLPRW